MGTITPLPKLYSSDELAEYLDVPVRTIRRWAHDGKISYSRLGRRNRYTQAAVEAFIAEHQIEARAPRRRRS